MSAVSYSTPAVSEAIDNSAPHDKAHRSGIVKRVLAEDDDFKIVYYDQGSSRIIITFGEINSGISDIGFGTTFVLGRGYDHIYVAQRAGTQYQGLSLQQFHDAVSEIIRGKEVTTYGSSLGGYCAVYYGGCIDATIIAAAPKNSALPELLKPNFKGVFKHLPLSKVPKSSKRPVLLYDPFRAADAQMVQQIIRQAYPNAHTVEIPFAGHNVLKLMQRAGGLKSFVLSIIENGVVEQLDLQDVGFHQEAVRRQLLERGDYLVRTGAASEACALVSKAISVRPTAKAYRILTRALVAAGRAQEAVAGVRRGLELFPDDPGLHQLLQDLKAQRQVSQVQGAYKHTLRRLGQNLISFWKSLTPSRKVMPCADC